MAAEHPENCNVCELSDDSSTPRPHRMGYEEDDLVVVRSKPRMSTGGIIMIVIISMLLIGAITAAIWCSCSNGSPQFGGGGRIRGGGGVPSMLPSMLPSSIGSLSTLHY